MPSSQPRVGGFNQYLGLRIVEYEEGHCVMELPVEERHLNRSGIVHGGVLATLIDAATSHAGNHAPEVEDRPRSVTVAMSIQYLGQAKKGPLRAVGTRTGGGRSIFFARAEVFDAQGTLVAAGDMTGKRLVRPSPDRSN